MKIRLLLVLLTLTVAGGSAQAASQLTNVSVRSTAGSGSDTLIVGFTVAGTGTKPILVRGVGPTLAAFGLSGVVSDPELRLFGPGGAAVAENDNWGGGASITAAASTVGAFTLSATSLDAALLATLTPGSYSTHVSGRTGGGLALIEVYDANQTSSTAQISNVSARSVAGTGASVLTVGFAIAGDTPKTVLIRAVGPTLTSFGVGGALVNPQLRLFSAKGTQLGTNDDWPSAAGWSATFLAVGAFPLVTNTRDAVLLVSLPPGTYTAQASGVNATSGVALVEVYDVPTPPTTSIVLQPEENAVPASFPSGFERAVTQAAVTSQARPTYPFALRAAGIEGEALIQFIAGADGRVSDAFTVRATDSRFAEAALAAVRQWTFVPGRTAGGQPTSTVFQVPIVFTLN